MRAVGVEQDPSLSPRALMRAAMKTNAARRSCAAIAALVAWSALALQLWIDIVQAEAHGGTVWQAAAFYFSYFTILTNILTATALTSALFGTRQTPRPGDMAAVAIYMVMVGAVFFLLLRHHPVTRPGFVADVALHYVMPTLFILYWLLFVPKGSLGRRPPLIWFAYPVAYFAVTLLRGALTGFYPYFFINAATLGYAKVATIALALLAVIYAVGFGFVQLDRALNQRQVDSGTSQA
jgi:hypothetical protein